MRCAALGVRAHGLGGQQRLRASVPVAACLPVPCSVRVAPAPNTACRGLDRAHHRQRFHCLPGCCGQCMQLLRPEQAVAPQADAHTLPEILQAVSPEEVRHKQVALARVWRRFLYADYAAFPAGLERLRRSLAGDMDAQRWPRGSPPAAYHGAHGNDDAFSTIVEWLYHRLAEQRDAGAA